MPLSSWRSSPVTAARAMTGVPRAPKRPAPCWRSAKEPDAASGENPRPISIDGGHRHGCAEPGGALQEGPKQKAMKRTCSRRSSLTPAMLRCKTSNSPFRS